MNLAETLYRSYPPAFSHVRHIEAALSGGLDSVVLLHLLARLQGRLNIKLTAVHVHHGLQQQADGWLDFCQNICQNLSVPLRWQKAEVRAQGLGIEAAARRERYRIFAQTPADVVAAAHHADDQVETFMLAALRGGSLRALAAMPEYRPLADGKILWRPLLPFSRAQLAAYAAEHRLPHIEDPSNQSGDYLRNWLRHEGLPHWRRRRPDLDLHILTGVSLLQDELAVLDEVAAADLAAVQADGLFDSGIWRQLSPARRRQALLQFAQQQHLGVPSRASIRDFQRILDGLGGGTAQWRLPQGRIEAYNGKLFALPDNAALPLPAFGTTVCPNDLAASEGWRLEAAGFGLPETVLREPALIRPVGRDDILHLGAGGKKKAAKLLQEYRIPPFLRPVWPVLADSGGRCLALAGLRTDARVSVKNGRLPVYRPLLDLIGRPPA
ncbi:MAG: tRNA lysidine(34) synthetase TilS [Neisseria sp.]|nr:tRNA lysidine(34) synthetase TilS [Neisseria sp.]